MLWAISPALAADDNAPQTSPADLALEYNKRINKMLSAGSTPADVDALFSLYSDDFIYNHPGQGDEYDTQVLYNNSVKYLKEGRFDGSYQQQIVNMIVGKDAAVLEWVVPGNAALKRMTFIEVRDGKIVYIKEYW
jgi:hypothetical protein